MNYLTNKLISLREKVLWVFQWSARGAYTWSPSTQTPWRAKNSATFEFGWMWSSYPFSLQPVR